MSANTEWQLSGNAAELYEEYLVPTIFIPWAQRLLAQKTPQQGENVLDVACGTGIVARMAKARVGESGRVVGVDLNAGMLDVARAVVPEGLIEWVQADVGDMPLTDQTFDVAYCQQGLQFFPDKVGALREIGRLLRPGGECLVVVAQSLEQNPLMRSQAAALSKHVNDSAAAGIRAVCGLPNPEEIAQLFEDAGYVDVEHNSVDLTLTYRDGRAFVRNGIMSTPLAGIVSGWPEDARNAFLDDILDGFGHYFDGASLAFPHVSSVVTGTKP